MNQDSDYQWLLSHQPPNDYLQPRRDLAKKVAKTLQKKINNGSLPYTVGVFGGWGSGKTTFLAMLAKELENDGSCQIVYFNSWKYAGFMEIVPSLIYKILHFGVKNTDENRNKAATRVLLSLGKEYSDRFGKWAEDKIGVDLVGLFNDVRKLRETVKSNNKTVPADLLETYYGQVDRAQDCLVEVLGKVEKNKPAKDPIVVLIDELDRCDPDEAFEVIKQMRVLFAMRQLPVVFVVCANPEPIGLAIKHRYGLESATGDYEARRILEKFVDAYEDLAESVSLADLVRAMWVETTKSTLPWIIEIDEANGDVCYEVDTVRHANAFDTITTNMPLYSNLRVLRKSFDYVKERTSINQDLLWTIWHLEILTQLDPNFREQVRQLAPVISDIARVVYIQMKGVKYSTHANGANVQIEYKTDKGKTMFAIYRSFFWENARAFRARNRLGVDTDFQFRQRVEIFEALLLDYRKMDFIISLSLVPFERVGDFGTLTKQTDGGLPDLQGEFESSLAGAFGYTLANY